MEIMEIFYTQERGMKLLGILVVPLQYGKGKQYMYMIRKASSCIQYHTLGPRNKKNNKFTTKFFYKIIFNSFIHIDINRDGNINTITIARK